MCSAWLHCIRIFGWIFRVNKISRYFRVFYTCLSLLCTLFCICHIIYLVASFRCCCFTVTLPSMCYARILFSRIFNLGIVVVVVIILFSSLVVIAWCMHTLMRSKHAKCFTHIYKACMTNHSLRFSPYAYIIYVRRVWVDRHHRTYSYTEQQEKRNLKKNTFFVFDCIIYAFRKSRWV